MPTVALVDREAMVTPAYAAAATGLSRQLIRDWYIRGRLKRDKQTGLVRYGDVLDLEAATRNCDRAGTFTRKPRQYAAA